MQWTTGNGEYGATRLKNLKKTKIQSKMEPGRHRKGTKGDQNGTKAVWQRRKSSECNINGTGSINRAHLLMKKWPSWDQVGLPNVFKIKNENMLNNKVKKGSRFKQRWVGFVWILKSKMEASWDHNWKKIGADSRSLSNEKLIRKLIPEL